MSSKRADTPAREDDTTIIQDDAYGPVKRQLKDMDAALGEDSNGHHSGNQQEGSKGASTDSVPHPPLSLPSPPATHDSEATVEHNASEHETANAPAPSLGEPDQSSHELPQPLSNPSNITSCVETSTPIAPLTAFKHRRQKPQPIGLPLAAPMGYFTRNIAPEDWDCFWAHVANLQNWPMRDSVYRGYSEKVSRREAMKLVEHRPGWPHPADIWFLYERELRAAVAELRDQRVVAEKRMGMEYMARVAGQNAESAGDAAEADHDGDGGGVSVRPDV